MRGSESRTQRTVAARTTIGADTIDLTAAEKLDLVLFSGTPAYAAILKLMESAMVEARDEAVRIPISRRDDRAAALDMATAISECYLRLKEKIEYLVGEHLGQIKRKVAEEQMQDQSEIERILLDPINAGH